MLTDPLTLKDSTGTDRVFDRISSTTDPKTGKVTNVYDDASRTDPSQPRKLTITNSITGNGVNRVRRVTILLADTKLNVAGLPFTTTFQGSWVFALNGTFAAVDLDNLICLGSDLYLSTSSLAVDASKRAALQQGQA